MDLCRTNGAIPAPPRRLASRFLGPSSFPLEPPSVFSSGKWGLSPAGLFTRAAVLCAQVPRHVGYTQMLKRRVSLSPAPLFSQSLHGWDWETVREAGIPPTREASTVIAPHTLPPSTVTGKDMCEGGTGLVIRWNPCLCSPSEGHRCSPRLSRCRAASLSPGWWQKSGAHLKAATSSTASSNQESASHVQPKGRNTSSLTALTQAAAQHLYQACPAQRSAATCISHLPAGG